MNTEDDKIQLKNESVETDTVQNSSHKEITDITKENPEDELLDKPDNFFTRLTEGQQKICQIILGLLAGFLVWVSLTIGLMNLDNAFFRWLFIFVFAIIMIGKNHIERTTGIQLRTFTKFFLIGLIIFLAAYIIYGAANGLFNQPFINQ